METRRSIKDNKRSRSRKMTNMKAMKRDRTKVRWRMMDEDTNRRTERERKKKQ